MRLDLPHELPRRHPEMPAAPPLAPSPVERRLEQLAVRANEHRGPKVAPQHQERNVSHQRPRERRQRTVAHEHSTERRPRRNDLPNQMVGLSLRDEERTVLAEVGRFRVVTTRDLAETVYANRHSQMTRDLSLLREKGLVKVDAVNARRDGRGGKVERIEVVTLTRAGRDAARQTSGLPQDQQLYAGLVKPREVEHDAQIYRAYCKEAARIEQKGGTNLRVRLDFELKSDVQKAIHAAGKAEPGQDMAEIKQQVAQQFELPYVNDGIQIPDARIEYDLDRKGGQEMDQGARSGHEDIEVLTAAYSPGHLRAKAQAGFHLYASPSDRATLTAKIEGNHYLMENILEL